MKKVLYFVLFALTAVLCSCGESYTPNQQAAIQIAQNNCIAPSTFQLVRVGDELTMPEKVEYDTAYYCLGRPVYFKAGLKDSMVVTKKTTPAYNFIIVEYDAQNAYGAMIRSQYHMMMINGLVSNVKETEEIVCRKKLN